MSEVDDLKSEVGERISRGTSLNLTPAEGNYSFTSVTEKVKRYLAHKVLPHCKF